MVKADSISLELPRALSDSIAVSYPNRIDEISGSVSADGLLQKLSRWSVYEADADSKFFLTSHWPISSTG